MRESRFDAQDRPLSVEDVATGTVAAVVDRALCHRIRCSPVRMFDYTVEVVSRGREPIRVSAAFHAAIAATCAAP